MDILPSTPWTAKKQQQQQQSKHRKKSVDLCKEHTVPRIKWKCMRSSFIQTHTHTLTLAHISGKNDFELGIFLFFFCYSLVYVQFHLILLVFAIIVIQFIAFLFISTIAMIEESAPFAICIDEVERTKWSKWYLNSEPLMKRAIETTTKASATKVVSRVDSYVYHTYICSMWHKIFCVCAMLLQPTYTYYMYIYGTKWIQCTSAIK